MKKENKESKVYKSITIAILLIILAVAVGVGALQFIILKQQKLFFEKYEDSLEALHESIKETEENIIREIENEFDLIMQRNMQSERAISGKIDNTNRRIVILNEVYEGILKEQEKMRVESLFSDMDLQDKMAEAAGLMREGKINQAYALYELIATEQPGNQEARFYMYYSLFLKNRSDREEYSRIKNGFAVLEREGYIRGEMAEVLSYIEDEESYSSTE